MAVLFSRHFDDIHGESERIAGGMEALRLPDGYWVTMA